MFLSSWESIDNREVKQGCKWTQLFSREWRLAGPPSTCLEECYWIWGKASMDIGAFSISSLCPLNVSTASSPKLFWQPE